MSDLIQSEGTKALDQAEHNRDANAKRVLIRAQDPGSGDFVNVGATDNGDGTFSLKTTATVDLSGATINGPAAYSDSGGTDRKGLVDADRHVQVDVLTSALPTGAATAANQQTDALTDTELRATPVVVDLGANNDVTVTGTVTANLGATDNAVLDDIAANQTDNSQKTQIVDSAGNAVTVTGNKLDVNASVSTAGLATDTNQTTIIGHLDGVEGLLTTIDADTGGILTAVQTLDNAISGTEMQVDVVAALPAGDNNIGNVDVVSMPTTTVTATNLDIRDLAQASDNVRVYANTVKDGSGTGYVPLVDADGHLQIDVLSAPAATIDTTGLATSANQTTLIGHVDGIEGLLTTIDTVLDTIKVDTEAIETATEAIQAAQLPDGHNVTVDNASLAVTNAGLTELAAAINASSQVDVNIAAGNITGFATSAKQDTIIGHLDGVEGILTTIDTDTGSISTNMATVAGAVSGTEMQVDVLTMPTVAVTGTFWQATQPVSGTVTANLSATDNAVLDNIDTAVTSKYISSIGHGVTTVTTAGTDVALAASTPCKKVTIQAQTDNTGVIAVGASGVDATVATGTGILLFAGDTYEFDIDNLADVFIDSSVNGEGVRYTYFN